MPTRSPLQRSLLGIGVGLGGVIAVVGGLALSGPGLVAAGVAGGVSAALAAGVVREAPQGSHARAVEAAWQACACTLGVILLVAGVATLAGGVVAALLTLGALAAAGGVAVQRLRRRRPGTAAPGARWPSAPPAPGATRTTAARGPATSASDLPPVSALPTSALGREWLRTASALAGRLQPAARESIVRRRQQTLDELEARDPAGFARWMAGGPAPGSDPAQFVHGDVRGDRAAGSDAA